ncbi:Regulator_of chromosome condensation (RCC1) repeat-containing protein [Hexamita inflata]|uniref:Regulator_of chromosome condensation (RCC1) repeat-containing protein n=1 Tax=Hexamita inflata TaxID=28002 RepID=A0ABP1HT72_9EUKA
MFLQIVVAYDYMASGSNQYGQLGLNLQDTQISKFTKQTSFFDSDIIKITAGSTHALAVVDSGKLYVWGNNNKMQLATDVESQYSKPIVVQYFVDNSIKISQADGGIQHSIALGTNGKVYTWGNNNYGQLGRSIDNTDAKSDKTPGIVDPKVYGNEIVKQIAAQNHSTYILTTAGHLYAFGSCMQGSCSQRSTAGQVVFDGKIDRFFVGELSLFVEDDQGQVFASGANLHSQLCFSVDDNDKMNYQMQLKKIPVMGVDHIDAGETHTLLIQGTSVLGCGLNTDWQMGPIVGTFKAPTLIFEHAGLRSAAACQDGSLFLIGDEFSVIGSSMNGELGLPVNSVKQERVQVPLSMKYLTEVICRKTFSIVYSQHEKQKQGLNAWAISGIVIGSILAVLIIAFFIGWGYISYNKKQHYKKFVSAGTAEAQVETW